MRDSSLHRRSRRGKFWAEWSWMFLLLGLLVGCGGTPATLPGEQEPQPTPTAARYPVDVEELGFRLWVPQSWQVWKASDEPGRPWIFLLPPDVGNEGDEVEEEVLGPSSEEGEEGWDPDALPPDPPYILAYAYPRERGAALRGRDVYFALSETGLVTVEDVEIGQPRPVTFPRGQGWEAELTLQSPDGTIYRGRLTILSMPESWVFVMVGVVPEGSWETFWNDYREMLVRVDFFPPLPTPTPES